MSLSSCFVSVFLADEEEGALFELVDAAAFEEDAAALVLEEATVDEVDAVFAAVLEAAGTLAAAAVDAEA